MNETSSDPDPKLSSPSDFNIVRVLGTVVALALVCGLGYGAFSFINRPKSLVKVTGRVMWDGEPVTIGAVTTQHTEDPVMASIGSFDQEGRFELSTNGQPGAMPGVHKVIVGSYGAGMGTTPLVPAEYLKATTTPLSITVTSDPAKNHFELVVVGEHPKYESRGGGGGGPPGGGGGGPRGGGGPPGGGRGNGQRPASESTPDAPAETPSEATGEAATAPPATPEKAP